MEITFTVIGGATWILDIHGIRIACDPVLCPAGTVQDYFWFKAKRIESPIFDNRAFDNIALWLLTHGHEDHLDALGVQRIKEDAGIVCRGNAGKKLPAKLREQARILRWGGTADFQRGDLAIHVEAVPAIHGVNSATAFFAGPVNGYLLTVTHRNETLSIYVTGDTVLHNKVLRRLNGQTIDLLIPNMGAARMNRLFGPLTLSASMLKKLITVTQPKLVIPVHFSAFEHYVEPPEEITALHDERIKILKPGETRVFSV